MKKQTRREPQESGGHPQGGRVAKTPKWRAAPAPLVARFDHAVAALPEIQQRKMFGYPAAFVNGHMFAGVFQVSLFVRLAEKDRTELIAKHGATPFAPMPGRVMRESTSFFPHRLSNPRPSSQHGSRGRRAMSPACLQRHESRDAVGIG